MKPDTLTVATVQVACQLGDREGNLANATTYVKQAAQQGAKLVLLPEMMPGGYTLNEAIWDTAEPFDGPTTQWMRTLSQRLKLYLGTSFLEADGENLRHIRPHRRSRRSSRAGPKVPTRLFRSVLLCRRL